MLTARELATILAALRRWQQMQPQMPIIPLITAWPHFADNPPLSAAEIDTLCQRLNFPCDCEASGPFWSGIPGILGRVVHGRIDPASVERCDACERYPSDDVARERLRELKLLR